MMTANLFCLDAITLELKGSTQHEAIDELASLLDNCGVLRDKEVFLQAIFAREAISTTAVEYGIAIPHGKSEAVDRPMVAYGYSKHGIQYNPNGGGKSHLFFMIAVPEDSDNLHLRLLSSLSRKLVHEDFRELLKSYVTKEQVLEILLTV